MGKAHTGLHEILKKGRIKLGDGDMAVFLNNPGNAFKVIDNRNVILYYRDPTGARMNSELFSLLPHYVKGGTVDWQKLTEAVLQRAIKRRRKN
jgi:hypothetical protein